MERRRVVRHVALLATACALAVPAAASADISAWWFSGGSIGAGYLDTTGTAPNGTLATQTGRAYMYDMSGSNDVAVELNGKPSADYCGYYRTGTGSVLNGRDSNSEGSWTGFTPSTPYSNWQEGDLTHANVCQAQGTTWGFKNTGSTLNNFCGGGKTCGMHHFASNNSHGTSDRPWDKIRFGPFPSFYLYLHEDPNKAVDSQHSDGQVGNAWGYVCPHFRDTSGSNVEIEFCFEPWYAGNGIPAFNGSLESPSSAAGAYCQEGAGGIHFDMIQVHFAAGTSYATERTGSTDTFHFTSPIGSRVFTATISRDNMTNAINAIRQPKSSGGCGWGNASPHPEDWAYMGIENGQEGNVLEGLGSSVSQLTARTVTDTLYHDQRLNADQQLYAPDGSHRVIMQDDGNLVIYDSAGHAVWASGTFGAFGAYAIMQLDGNFVIYNSANQPIWATGKYGSGNYLIMQMDGNLVVYHGTTPLWSAW
jgi:hypothetical protein